MNLQYVIVSNERVDVEYNSLDLSDRGIIDIFQIRGFDRLMNLQYLYLSQNKITEIRGLGTLINLQELRLGNNQIIEIKGLDTLTKLQTLFLNDNQITEIKGLEVLTNLQSLNISGNKIPQALLEHIGEDAQRFVKYCRRNP